MWGRGGNVLLDYYCILQANLPSAGATPTQAVVSQYIPLCHPNLQQWSSSHIYLVAHVGGVVFLWGKSPQARITRKITNGYSWKRGVRLGSTAQCLPSNGGCRMGKKSHKKNPCWTYLLYVYNMISIMSLKPEFRSDSVLLSNHTHSMTTCTTKKVTSHSEQQPINNSFVNQQ